MKAKTKALLNLISQKKKEEREYKFNKAIHEYAMKHHHTLTREGEREFSQMVKEGMHLLQIDKKADEQLNRDVAKVHKRMFGY